MTDLEKSRLIAAIAARLKIRLDEDDPAFVLVELNRLVLDQTVRDALQRVRDLGPIRSPSNGEELAKEFAAFVAQSVVTKLSRPPGTQVWVWAAALVCAFTVTLFALAAGYELGGMTCALK